MKYDLCKDNLICCDDNCKRCANLIYQKYMELKEPQKVSDAAMIEELEMRWEDRMSSGYWCGY